MEDILAIESLYRYSILGTIKADEGQTRLQFPWDVKVSIARVPEAHPSVLQLVTGRDGSNSGVTIDRIRGSISYIDLNLKHGGSLTVRRRLGAEFRVEPLIDRNRNYLPNVSLHFVD